MARFHPITASRAAAATVLVAAAGAATAAPLLDVSRADVSFGRDAAGVEFVQPVFLTNVGDAPLTFTGFAITGPNASDYRVAGTCNPAYPLGAGGRCRLDVVGSPNTSPSSATLTIGSDGAAGPVAVALSATPSFDIARGPYATPAWVDFDHQPVGSTSAQVLTFTNPERIELIFESVAIGGRHASDFSFATDCVVNRHYANGESCATTVRFSPGAPGPRTAQIVFKGHPPPAGPGYVTETYSLTGVGGPAPRAEVVEYYNATLDHYFITWIPAEQANLDAGRTPTRWSRTGFSFPAYAAQQVGASPVCRYYLPPAFGDSHFFGRGTAECNATGIAHPAFVLEDPQFVQMVLPTAGTCPAGTTPIYRVFSNRPDANHRYMTDRPVRDQMVARGWLAEGDGADLVVMCAP